MAETVKKTGGAYNLQCIQESANYFAIIFFYLPLQSIVVLKIINQTGHDVRLLLNEELPTGTHTVKFFYGRLKGDYVIKLFIKSEKIIDINSLLIQIPSL